MFLETIGLKIVKLDKIENWTKLKIGQNCKLWTKLRIGPKLKIGQN